MQRVYQHFPPPERHIYFYHNYDRYVIKLSQTLAKPQIFHISPYSQLTLDLKPLHPGPEGFDHLKWYAFLKQWF